MPELTAHSIPTPHRLPPSLYAAPPDDPPAPRVPPPAAPSPPEPSTFQPGLQVGAALAVPPVIDPPGSPPAVPPIIDPKGHEAFPTFRETFMVYFTDPAANATMRGFGALLYDFLLAFWGDWPDPPEGMFRASMRAVVADLRCAQGALLELTGESFSPETPHEGYLASIGTEIAREVGRLTDRLEQELGSWRGGA